MFPEARFLTMTTNRNTWLSVSAVAAAIVTDGAATLAFAMDPAPEVEAPLLGLMDVESRLTAQGIRVTEMEVHDKVVEVEGYDAQGREIELIVDRRNAEILSRKFDD
jgi:hypothetical protein